MQVVSHAIQPSRNLGFSDGRFLSEFYLDSPKEGGVWQCSMESGLPVCPQESSPPPLMIASEWQCTDHWRSGNWLVICIDVKQQGTRKHDRRGTV